MKNNWMWLIVGALVIIGIIYSQLYAIEAGSGKSTGYALSEKTLLYNISTNSAGGELLVDYELYTRVGIGKVELSAYNFKTKSWDVLFSKAISNAELKSYDPFTYSGGTGDVYCTGTKIGNLKTGQCYSCPRQDTCIGGYNDFKCPTVVIPITEDYIFNNREIKLFLYAMNDVTQEELAEKCNYGGASRIVSIKFVNTAPVELTTTITEEKESIPLPAKAQELEEEQPGIIEVFQLPEKETEKQSIFVYITAIALIIFALYLIMRR